MLVVPSTKGMTSTFTFGALYNQFFNSSLLVFSAAAILRIVLLLWSQYQDTHSPVKYTDIDYYVFTDAARAVYYGRSPYNRATYRYTPLLAWILLPTAWGSKESLWFNSGKILFAACDIVAGGLILRLLLRRSFSRSQALKYASVWLLNPMVANISTRGSSEAALCVLVIGIVYAHETGQVLFAGILLGLAVHFKIYPFIYGVTLLLALRSTPSSHGLLAELQPRNLLNRPRLTLLISSILTFLALNTIMYLTYGQEFIEHTFRYHLTRLDHRHNFSVYNTLLYYSSSNHFPTSNVRFSPERLAFLPQMLLSIFVLPLLPTTNTKGQISTTMLLQTLAFVTFNKVCTSQYFLWYLIFLPLYLPSSSLTQNPSKGWTVLAAWVLGQVVWLWQGFKLEFNGKSTFVPGLFGAGMLFFVVNCGILGVGVQDACRSEYENGGAPLTVEPGNKAGDKKNK